MENSANYWNQRYTEADTPWDLGYASPALMEHVKHHVDKEKRILIPGAGHAYEIGELWNLGYHNIYVCDWSPKAIETAQKQQPEVPTDHFLCMDFFQLDHPFDLILEQTFFCALPPRLREQYVQKVAQLLTPNDGYLAGVFFNRSFEKEGPPFGGTTAQYEYLFQLYFDKVTTGPSPHSISPRKDHEVWLEARSPQG